MSPPPHSLPSICPPQIPLPAGEAFASAPSIASSEAPPQSQPVVSSETLLKIQSRLHDTQSFLASHIDKIHALETILAEQEALKREMHVLHDMMELESHERELTAQRVQEADREKEDHTSWKPWSNFDDDNDDNDNDDTQSVATITVRGLEHVDEEDEDNLEQENQQQLDDEVEIQDQDAETEEEKHRRREGLGRPRTPKPTMGMHAVILNGTSSHGLLSPSPKESPGPTPADTNEIFEHVLVLSQQVCTVLAVKSALEVQHVAAQVTIQALEKKVEALKAIVKSSHEQLPPLLSIQPPLTLALNEPKESITEILSKWKKSVQGHGVSSRKNGARRVSSWSTRENTRKESDSRKDTIFEPQKWMADPKKKKKETSQSLANWMRRKWSML